MKLLLWDKNDYAYRYYIETSNNLQDWEVAIDRRNEKCKSWQEAKFSPRIVTHIKIIGSRVDREMEVSFYSSLEVFFRVN